MKLLVSVTTDDDAAVKDQITAYVLELMKKSENDIRAVNQLNVPPQAANIVSHGANNDDEYDMLVALELEEATAVATISNKG